MSVPSSLKVKKMNLLNCVRRKVPCRQRFMLISCNTTVYSLLKWHQIREKSTPQNFTCYETLRQLYNPHIPEHFNFAKDVLDEWETKEKVGKTISGNIHMLYLHDFMCIICLCECFVLCMEKRVGPDRFMLCLHVMVYACWMISFSDQDQYREMFCSSPKPLAPSLSASTHTCTHIFT